ncbi:MAG: hypothetical protein WBW53_02980 [Terriglobales bacterium]
MSSEVRSWKDLCAAAMQEKDPAELLKIVEELNQILESEERIRRDRSDARNTNTSREEARC